jgi:hypothetical protein
VSLGISGTALINIGSIFYQDTDLGNKLELDNIVWSNGSGGGFSFSTPAGDPVTIDIGSDAFGQTIVGLHDSTQVSPRTFSADLIFDCTSVGCNPSGSMYLGSLIVSNIVLSENDWLFGAHGGLDFQNNENIAIGAAQYNYNTTNALTFSGIHFFGNTPPGFVAENISTWTYPGTFQIGNFANGQPAQIDIGTNATSGVTTIQFELPMTGSIAVTDVNFGGSDFGQLVLNDINVHRLTIQMHP